GGPGVGEVRAAEVDVPAGAVEGGGLVEEAGLREGDGVGVHAVAVLRAVVPGHLFQHQGQGEAAGEEVDVQDVDDGAVAGDRIKAAVAAGAQGRGLAVGEEGGR